MTHILTISGSDTLSGGGLQADLRTFYEHDVLAKQLLTCMVTLSQVDSSVIVYDLPKEVVYQFVCQMEQEELNGIKIGMLANLETAQLISDYLAKQQELPIVLDPVLALKESHYSGNNRIIPFFKEHLLPKASITTPNLREAELLSGIDHITSTSQMQEAAKIIFETGVNNVVIKGGERLGGHVARDILYDGTSFTEFEYPVIANGNINGAGCTFASAICANLAKGYSVEMSVSMAKTYVYQAIKHGVPFLDGLGNVWQQPVDEINSP